MSGFAAAAVAIALAAVLITLVLGLVSMTRGGAFNAEYGNKLMRLRVVLQFVAVVILALAFLIG